MCVLEYQSPCICMCVRERKCARVCGRLCFTSSLWWNDNAETRWMGYALCVGDSCSLLFCAHSHPHWNLKIHEDSGIKLCHTHTTGWRCCTSQQQNLTTRSAPSATVKHMWALHNVPITLIIVESESSSKVKSSNRAVIFKNYAQRLETVCCFMSQGTSLYSQAEMI